MGDIDPNEWTRSIHEDSEEDRDSLVEAAGAEKKEVNADEQGSGELIRPKRPLSAYNLFFRDQREIILRELPPSKTHTEASRRKGHGKIGFQALAKTIAAKWRAIDPIEKADYEGQAAQLRKLHAEQVAQWKKQMKRQGLPTKRPKKKKTGDTTPPAEPDEAASRTSPVPFDEVMLHLPSHEQDTVPADLILHNNFGTSDASGIYGGSSANNSSTESHASSEPVFVQSQPLSQLNLHLRMRNRFSLIGSQPQDFGMTAAGYMYPSFSPGYYGNTIQTPHVTNGSLLYHQQYGDEGLTLSFATGKETVHPRPDYAKYEDEATGFLEPLPLQIERTHGNELSLLASRLGKDNMDLFVKMFN